MRRIVDLAWDDLPRTHRALLESIGASQWDVVARPLGQHVHDLLLSAGHVPRPANQRIALDQALGTWVQELSVVLINVAHPGLTGLDAHTLERVLVNVAWHEWAHALSVTRATEQDIRDGHRLMASAPEGVAAVIRGGGYGPRQYTHELVADIYALLMLRRRQGTTGKPPWLDDEIYRLVERVTGWNR